MGAFGRTAAEYGDRQQTHKTGSRPTKKRHAAQRGMTRGRPAGPGGDERDATAADSTREDPRPGSLTSSALSYGDPASPSFQ